MESVFCINHAKLLCTFLNMSRVIRKKNDFFDNIPFFQLSWFGFFRFFIRLYKLFFADIVLINCYKKVFAK